MSRLDRLLSLIDNGSSAVIRKAAAVQLGEVQRLHPHELHNLLSSVSNFLRSSSWDTRIAAGQALEAILRHVPKWDPVGSNEEDDSKWDLENGYLSFKTFSFENVVNKSAHLMACEMMQIEDPEIQDNSATNLEKQRKELNKKMGLDAAASLGINTDDIYNVEDLAIQTSTTEDPNVGKLNVGEVVGASYREMNRARRKAKMALRRQSSRPEEPDVKRPRNEPTSSIAPPSAPVPDTTGLWPPEAEEWPLEWFCKAMCADLFASHWETRHGAGTALKHLIASHGQSGGRSYSLPAKEMDKCNQLWLEDIALRLVCVLALDRFGDFNSDQVVAPVRETCAQALGSVTLHMSKKQVIMLASTLLKLLDLKDWEARHGGLLGLKYTFAVRKDTLEELVPVCIDSLHTALGDGTDDVGAAAGGALSLAVPVIAKIQPIVAASIFDTLASLLPRLDDLTPAANTFVPLMVTLLNHTQISHNLKNNEKVQKLLERMFYLMAHNNSSVRKAALQTVKALSSYTGPLLTQCLRHVFQRALIEHDVSIPPIIYEVWCALVDTNETIPLLEAACPFVSHWLCLAMQPTKLPYDPTSFLQLSKEERNSTLHNLPPGEAEALMKQSELKLYIGGNETLPFNVREKNALDVRYQTGRMIGYLSKVLVIQLAGSPPGAALEYYTSVLNVYLTSKSAIQRMITALTITHWAAIEPPSPPPIQLITNLNSCLNETIYFDEIGPAFTKLLQETKDFLALLKHYQLPNAQNYLNQNVLTFDQMESVCSDEVASQISKIKIKKTVDTLESRRKTLKTSITSTVSEFSSLSVKTQATVACAVLKLGQLPEKLGPIVKPLMDSIKREHHLNLQMMSAEHLCELMDHCLQRTPSPAHKIITNLCSYVKSDPEFTPIIFPLSDTKVQKIKKDKSVDKKKIFNDPYTGVVTLARQQKIVENALLKGNRGPGRPCKATVLERKLPEVDPSEEDLKQKGHEVARRGATLALRGLVLRYGEKLPEKLPSLWQPLYQALNNHTGVIVSPTNGSSKGNESLEKTEAEAMIGVLQVLEVVIPSLHNNLFLIVLQNIGRLVEGTGHKLSGVRHMAGRAVAAAMARDPVEGLPKLIAKLLPRIAAPDANVRSGATEAVATLIDRLQLNVISHLSKLVIPILGRMSDQDICVRALANQTFASLIQLVPLGEGALDADGPDSFLYNLFRPATIADYNLPIPINAKLRPYQQAGLNWLYFLNRYKLHGILCDDMGLGKTIQSICIIAGDHYDRSVKYKETGRSDCAALPSLVICPPTLTGHWYLEVKKFVASKYLNPLQFSGVPAERKRLQCNVKDYNLIIASYDIVRNDIDFFKDIKWNYCILDEGHVIKNGKTKWTKAIKTLEANHRLILSGTPIQNNVLELWSLFDFLMPGFLGSEKQFNGKFSKPILASRDPKSTQKEQQAGVLAMEALHRRVLPFVLRRLKEDVLKELPPKITQDYYCELSPLQKLLYDDFSHTQAQNLNFDNIEMKQGHAFQALRYMQSVCNHPKLALRHKASSRDAIMAQLAAQGSNLSDIKHSTKLLALKQLLMDCGIGVESNDEMEVSESSVVNQHRALIFCQLRAMLDILEHDFFKLHMPGVSYLRLDSNLTPASRLHTIQLFNNDPSYDVLLLTTRVGGLGLNLTGADTVIFVEHDWSPMRDLQAMDRAHRIGQKKVVNVYRLITKNTMEERIMGLQKFKLLTANTVISSENACLETMGTEKLLELFSSETNKDADKDGIASGGLRALIDSLPPLSETTEYDEEYDIDNYLAALPPRSSA